MSLKKVLWEPWRYLPRQSLFLVYSVGSIRNVLMGSSSLYAKIVKGLAFASTASEDIVAKRVDAVSMDGSEKDVKIVGGMSFVYTTDKRDDVKIVKAFASASMEK